MSDTAYLSDVSEGIANSSPFASPVLPLDPGSAPDLLRAPTGQRGEDRRWLASWRDGRAAYPASRKYARTRGSVSIVSATSRTSDTRP